MNAQSETQKAARPSQGAKREGARYVEGETGHDTPCWLWQLAKTRNGYAFVRRGDKMVYGHRAYYEERFGPIPEGLSLDHLCRVRSCVNPEHLEPVTPAENCRRGKSAKLTHEAVEDIRGSIEPHRVLAKRYGVSQSQVSKVQRGKSWA